MRAVEEEFYDETHAYHAYHAYHHIIRGTRNHNGAIYGSMILYKDV